MKPLYIYFYPNILLFAVKVLQSRCKGTSGFIALSHRIFVPEGSI